ncbi:YheC/YheD family protein [Cohnella sp.]|uniref:YheC/YheD family endospore coat-associated protein n=1 Tax=Cohnella sp. TaxID=1883426 RepID=UPI00356B3AAD
MPAIFPDFSAPTSASTSRALGILVCERDGNPPFAESSFIKRLSLIGAGSGLELFAFAPWSWEEQSNLVKGWVWNKQKQRWDAARYTLPAVVYDRSWPVNKDEKIRFQQAIQRLQEAKRITYLNNRMPHKGKIYEILSKDPSFQSILPPTAVYDGPSSLALWLSRHNYAAFLKPIAGSQGKRVVAVVRKEDGTVNIRGRQSDNRPLSINCVNEQAALRLLQRWIGQRAYLMQPLLDLRGPEGEPLDLRALMQKNNNGHWTLTGIAARCGMPGTVTSNLHGGGKASSAKEVLVSLFGELRGIELLQEIRRISFQLVNRLEETLGRFAEIGMDYGIDRSGRIWFLEANSKPGRAAMESVGKAAAKLAAEQPLSYARSILLRPPGRVIHEFDHL